MEPPEGDRRSRVLTSLPVGHPLPRPNGSLSIRWAGSAAVVLLIAATALGLLYSHGHLGVGGSSNVARTESNPSPSSTNADSVGTITEFAVPTDVSLVGRITYGPDGNLWLIGTGTNGAGDLIIRMTPSGGFTEYTVPSAGSLWGITAGPDGDIWFTETQGVPGDVATDTRQTNVGRVVKVTTSGTFTEYSIPAAETSPTGIATGFDRNLWVTDAGANSVDKVTTYGGFSKYRIPTANSDPGEITAGPDGNLWFTEPGAAKVARITASGMITEFSLPDPLFRPWGITTGRDGNLWITEWSRLGAGGPGKVAKVTISGSVTEYPIPPLAGSLPFEEPGPGLITAGTDGNLWFTVGDNLDRVTATGVVTQYIIPGSDERASYLVALTNGPGGSIWFVTGNHPGQLDQVGKLLAV